MTRLVIVSILLSTAIWAQERNLVIETVAGSDGDGRAATSFSLENEVSVAADVAGNIYFASERQNRVYRVGADGVLHIAAGSGASGAVIEGALAVESPLPPPYALALDGAGNLFISSFSSVVRVDTTSGTISTFLNSSYRGPHSSTSIGSAISLVFSANGDLYVADQSDHRIKRLRADTGDVVVVAGSGVQGHAVPGSLAATFPLGFPESVAVDRDGNVFFTDSDPGVFRVDSDTGILSSVAGTGTAPFSRLQVSARGDLFVLSGMSLLRGDPDTGRFEVVSGPGAAGESSVITMPFAFALDRNDNPIVTSFFPTLIRKVDLASGQLHTIAGNGLTCYNGDGTPALEEQLCEPASVAPAPDGTLYLTSSFANLLLQIGTDGTVRTVAGGGDVTSMGGGPGAALEVALLRPQGIWLDPNGDVYFTDFDNVRVRKLSSSTGKVTNFAQAGGGGGPFRLDWAAALIADSQYLYKSDPYGNRVWRTSRSDGTSQPYAGNGHYGLGRDGASATDTELPYPSGLALDNAGNLYIADGFSTIRRVDPTTRLMTIVAAGLQNHAGLAFGPDGRLCFTELRTSQVRSLDLQTGAITTLAGTGTPGFSGDGGDPAAAQLNRPGALVFDAGGSLYIVDTGNQRIRRVYAVSSSTKLGRRSRGRNPAR